MRWADEAMGWLVSSVLIDEVGPELDRISGLLRGGALEERLAAVKQLTYLDDPGTVSLLIGALKDLDGSVRAEAAAVLGNKGSAEAITPLGVLLSDSDAGVRAAVVEALDAIGLPRPRSWIQFWRQRILSPVDDPRIADLLGRALTDPDLGVRTAALRVLPRHGAAGVAVVRESVAGQPEADRPALLAAAEPELVRALEARDPAHRQAAVEALFRLYGEQALRPLSEALKDPVAEVRSAAVAAVSALGPRPVLKDLLDCLDDPDEGVVVKVVEGLVCAHNLGAFEVAAEDGIHRELLQLARRDAGRAQEVAAWALGEIGRVGAVGTLCELLAEPRLAVVAAACAALGKINDPRAVGPLLAVLERDASPEVTIAAARTLALAGDVRVIPQFVRMSFAESRPAVEGVLEEGLAALCRQVEEAAAQDLQHPDPKVRLAAVRRAISEPRLVFALIGQIVDAPRSEVGAAALDVLGKLGYDLTALARSALVLDDKAEGRRILAINLMAAVAPEEAASRLEALLTDPNEPAEVYRHTVAALKRLDSDASRAALDRQANHPQEAVREWIRQARA